MVRQSYRKIDTELFKALISADFTRSGYKVVLVVIHFTLGYQKTEAEISLNTFRDFTALSRPAIKTALKLLYEKNIVNKVSEADNRKSTRYQLNVNYQTWIIGQADLSPRGKAGFPPNVKRDDKNLPSNDGKTYPPDIENLPSRGKVPTPATTHIKKERKPLKKTKERETVVDVKGSLSLRGNYVSPEGVTPSLTAPLKDVPTRQSMVLCDNCQCEATARNPISFGLGGRPLCERCREKSLVCSYCNKESTEQNRVFNFNGVPWHIPCRKADQRRAVNSLGDRLTQKDGTDHA